jgi:hypothetical protein
MWYAEALADQARIVEHKQLITAVRNNLIMITTPELLPI